MITIESDIPVPVRRFAVAGKHAELRAALERMRPGESFTIGAGKNEQAAIYRAADQVGARIITRKLNGAGFRVWRVG